MRLHLVHGFGKPSHPLATGQASASPVITHSGPGAGLYFELLPYAQETGGFEHIGLCVCQVNPLQVSNHLRQVISNSQKPFMPAA
jgi:hypothetical protein